MGRFTQDEAASIRSALFVPGDRPERFSKAIASGADAVILDLEDAVAPAGKLGARAAIAAFLDEAPQARIIVRINAMGTAFFEEDLILARHPQISAIMLPKAETAASIARVSELDVPVWAQVESALGLARINEVAGAAGCQRLVLGVVDMALDLNLDVRGTGGRAALDMARYTALIAARVAGIAAPMDSVFLDLDNEAGLIAMAQHARSFGLFGMLAIHPRQVAAINRVFSVSPDEIAWAQRVLAAAEAAGTGAFALDGRMVDEPVLIRARRISAHISRQI